MPATLDPIVEFREDHRRVRDSLLKLAQAAEQGEVVVARDTLSALDVMVGPHFRYEEEHLYPTLREFLGEYVDQLQREHDGVIATARVAADLLSKPALTAEERATVSRAARSLLIHVSNCDGLNILTERLSRERLDELGEQLQEARDAAVPLLRWADTIREWPEATRRGEA